MSSVPLTPELIAFIQSGVPIELATRDARRIPHIALVHGARYDATTNHVTVLVPERSSAATRADLANNRDLAVIFARPCDNNSYQLKGRVVSVEPESEADIALRNDYRKKYSEQVAVVGIPRSLSSRSAHSPCIAITFAVEQIFEQTPGPTAGRKLAT